jgi:hypothetical protein
MTARLRRKRVKQRITQQAVAEVVSRFVPLLPNKWDRVTISGASRQFPGANCTIIDGPVETLSGRYYTVELVKTKRIRFKVAFEYLCLTEYKRQASAYASLDGYEACVQNGLDPQGMMPQLLHRSK